MTRPADLTADELGALAYLVEQHRERTGHSTWDRGTIADYLAQLEHDVPTSLDVALRAADDPRAETPHALTWSRHQPAQTPTSTTSTPTREPVCLVCQSTRPVHDRKARLTGDPHPFDTGRRS